MTGAEKIISDLDWRGPNGKSMGHVVLTRRQAEEVLAQNKILHQLITNDAMLIERYNAAMDVFWRGT